MVVELHRKVSSLIEYLKQKWAYHDQRIVSFNTSFDWKLGRAIFGPIYTSNFTKKNGVECAEALTNKLT